MVEESKTTTMDFATQPQDILGDSWDKKAALEEDTFEKLCQQLKEVDQENHSTQLSIQLINDHVDELMKKDRKVEKEHKREVEEVSMKDKEKQEPKPFVQPKLPKVEVEVPKGITKIYTLWSEGLKQIIVENLRTLVKKLYEAGENKYSI